MSLSPDRQEDLGPTAPGGMGEVRRLRERLLRAVAGWAAEAAAEQARGVRR